MMDITRENNFSETAFTVKEGEKYHLRWFTPGGFGDRGVEEIRERHRHRYEFNNAYRERLQANGLSLSGQSPDGYIVEAVELSEKRFFVGVQFHPEFKSRPNHPHPLFVGLIRASLEG